MMNKAYKIKNRYIKSKKHINESKVLNKKGLV